MNLHLVALALGLSLISQEGTAATKGHEECERQFKKLSKGFVVAVPEVKDWGDAREYYFAWNTSSQSQPLVTKNGRASASCVINRQTGEGFVTLSSKDLGKFKAKAPL